MQGKATSKDLLRLETIYSYTRNNDSITALRNRVKEWEQSTKEKAEKSARSKLNKSTVTGKIIT